MLELFELKNFISFYSYCKSKKPFLKRFKSVLTIKNVDLAIKNKMDQ